MCLLGMGAEMVGARVVERGRGAEVVGGKEARRSVWVWATEEGDC